MDDKALKAVIEENNKQPNLVEHFRVYDEVSQTSPAPHRKDVQVEQVGTSHTDITAW